MGVELEIRGASSSAMLLGGVASSLGVVIFLLGVGFS